MKNIFHMVLKSCRMRTEQSAENLKENKALGTDKKRKFL